MSKKNRRDIPRFQTPIMETHCHLDYLDEEQLGAVLEKSSQCGIADIITIAVSPDNLDRVVELTDRASNIWGTQGIHPHEAETYNNTVDNLIRQRMDMERIIAVGEIGLDYYYDHADRAVQRRVFERQLQIAADLDMPVVIHTRDADDDTRDILSAFSGVIRRRGVIHSFTAGVELAEFCLDEGYMLGFNGIATFNRADNVREVIAITPLDRILLETDAPYLTPVPYRGKPNAPYYLPFIAECVASIVGAPVEELLLQVLCNSNALFFPNRKNHPASIESG